MDILKVVNLQKKYENGDGVDDVQFCIQAGEIVALLGPNGAGKTTTIRCITGLYRPDQGHISIGNHTPGSVAAQQMVAFIPDQPFLYPTLTIAEHVQFRAKAFKVPKQQLKERVMQALAEVHLTDLADRMSGHLSRGQKQRAILAGAIVQNANLYVLDEPTVGLDIPAKQWLAKWLTAKAEQKCGVFICTHSLEFVLEIAHRVLLIQEGRIVKEMSVPKHEADWPEWRKDVIHALGEWTEHG
ncbi:ABC transporter ATP-binding protein [Paenibacillus sp. 481]|uniref:ABC transporter ATP-binding protein n=1 Tax=Paenibacillus sp. 481 TaxID=2835869 RepID=UPI001E4C3A87|nr:ABC transporter ATP-binding protein [Paenibacillus sp. 481]UHA71981.1 ABC transporter ATP-binding protein [Paenibacillus sp. 481]